MGRGGEGGHEQKNNSDVTELTVVLITEINREWAQVGCFRFAGSEVPAKLTDGNPRLGQVRPRVTDFMTT